MIYDKHSEATEQLYVALCEDQRIRMLQSMLSSNHNLGISYEKYRFFAEIMRYSPSKGNKTTFDVTASGTLVGVLRGVSIKQL